MDLLAASACFDMTRNEDGFGHAGLDATALVAALSNVVNGVLSELACFTCPSFPGTNPNHGADCMNCVVSICLYWRNKSWISKIRKIFCDSIRQEGQKK